MRLSEAIRLGAMLKPQAFGDFSDGTGTCAWGAANEAIGKSVDDDYVDDEWMDVCHADVRCPECGDCRGTTDKDADGQSRVASLIEHFNDDHLWTRERIADWLEGVEAKHATTTASKSVTA